MWYDSQIGKFACPVRVHSAIEFIVAAEEGFKVEDLPDCLDLAGKVVLIKRLFDEGLIEYVRDES